MPRRRGSASLSQTWPVIRALRRERFDRSVDFASNDRGAISSLLIGARQRLGLDDRGGFLGRRFCYNQRVQSAPVTQHESARLAHLLSAWGIVPPSLEAEIRADPALDASAEKLLPAGKVVCHVASSQPKKEWPVGHWAAFYQLAAGAGWRLVFTTASGAREQSLMDELKKFVPHAPILPVIPDLAMFLAVLKRAKGFHFRRHRAAAFCRRPGGADNCAVWSQFCCAMGATRQASPHSDRQPVRLQRRFGTLPQCEPLPGGDLTSAGFCQSAIFFEAGVKPPAAARVCDCSKSRGWVTFSGDMADAIPYLDLPAQLRGVRKDLDAAIARTIDHCSFCLGPDVAQFEKDFARFVGAEHCVGFNSGTSALHVAMLLLGVGPGDEVITTPFTFVATSWAISYVGAKPVYVDVDDATFNLDPKLIERAITPRTKAVMPVHLYGHPFDVDPILAVCRKHKLPLVEDAAQAHGAKYKGKIVGTFGEISCFSFYPGKNLGACGEGGALVTNNAAFDRRARGLREHGSTVRYYHDEVGYNYRMEGIQGAVAGREAEASDEMDERTPPRRASLPRTCWPARRCNCRAKPLGAKACITFTSSAIRAATSSKNISKPTASAARCITRCRCICRNVTRISATSPAIFPLPKRPRANA